ncbi:hypothetical protein [Microbacterium sp. Root61]|uniref:hypothetical protein n=1 Tax=Microbacterium sp. Root61 TaxID=1736570 RepID=UPI001F2FE963|nr:hypothetical protein [Microbacterium sp. Root61]
MTSASLHPADMLPGDFYGFQDELSEQESASIRRLRDFLDREVRPIAMTIGRVRRFLIT